MMLILLLRDSALLFMLFFNAAFSLDFSLFVSLAPPPPLFLPHLQFLQLFPLPTLKSVRVRPPRLKGHFWFYTTADGFPLY